MRTLVFGLLLALSIGLTTLSAAAADPVVPDSGDCQSDPQRSLLVLFATPVPADATSSSIPPLIESDGSPADAETVDAITATTRAVFACLNAGDYWSLITLLSDDYLRRSFVDGAPTDPLALDLEPFIDAVRGCEECEIAPLEGEHIFAIADITNVRVLADGRTVATVMLTSPSGAMPDWHVVAFVASDDQWLIDEIINVNSQGTPVAP